MNFGWTIYLELTGDGKNGQVTGDEAPGFVRDIGADKVEFNFKKPKSVKIGGSYAIECLVKPEFNVDLLVQLPKVFS